MGRWNIETKRRVAALLDCGLNHTEIARRLGITKHTVAYTHERCGVEDWLGEPLVFALHHGNGDNCDDRLESLALLSPNCHSQTENFAGRNVRSRRVA
jgi:hypothetical protein